MKGPPWRRRRCRSRQPDRPINEIGQRDGLIRLISDPGPETSLNIDFVTGKLPTLPTREVVVLYVKVVPIVVPINDPRN
nr:hypothetical protein Q903MT_gene749 [Picea sitchensis]